MNVSFPWNGSELLRREYEKDNYRLIHTGSKTNRAIIFFSGNGLYFPNTEEEFTQKIIINDRYEWENLASNKLIRKYYELIIFVRDVYKQWYVTGINPEHDNVDKTADFLRELTRGYDITTCGASAGGYAAVLFASLLDAERFFSMSGQFSIHHQIDAQGAPFVYNYASDIIRNKYYDIAGITHRGGGALYLAG